MSSLPGSDAIRRVTPALIAACLSTSALALGAAVPRGDPGNTELGSAEQAVLQDRQGLLEIEATDIPLATLLKALAAKASVEARLAEPSLASCSVNAKRQQAASLREAIERLLQGFSYALYPADSGALALTIVATCPPARPPAKTSIVEARPDEDEAPAEGAPLSLDEFESLAVEEPSDDEEEGQQAVGPKEQDEQAYRDAVVSRALKALHSPHHQIKEEAIGSLAGIRSPEVTQVLIDAASGKLDLTMEARTNAVATLSQNATGTDSPDTAALGVLEQLAKDADPAVSSIAQNALKDLQQRAVVSAAPVP